MPPEQCSRWCFPICGRQCDLLQRSQPLAPAPPGYRGRPRGGGGFRSGDQEYRFSCRFDTLDRGADAANPIQRGTCTLPDGQVLPLVVNDVKGAATSDGVFRVFAGLRSDPFYLAWLVESLKKAPNLLLHDNVLCIVIEFDTRRVLDPDKGSLFGVVAETGPVPHTGGFIGHDPPRFDSVGRPEQTNMRLNNPALAGTDDLRDLWNQQTPFAIPENSGLYSASA